MYCSSLLLRRKKFLLGTKESKQCLLSMCYERKDAKEQKSGRRVKKIELCLNNVLKVKDIGNEIRLTFRIYNSAKKKFGKM